MSPLTPPLGLTYDDVLLLPGETDVVPSEVDTTSRLTREISLRVPLVSSAMDTVTEARMAIAMARQGGIGVLHRNLSIADQARQVDLVKRTQTGIISNPITIGAKATLEDLDELCGQYRVSGLPVVDDGGLLLGIITNRDLRFVPVAQWATTLVGDVMTPMPLITAPTGVRRDEAVEVLRRHKRERLPIIDADGRLTGLITVKDFVKGEQYPYASRDADGRLLVAAAVGYFGDAWERAATLVEAGVDVLVPDVANGHARLMLDMIRKLKADPATRHVQVLGGNVATRAGAQALVDAGVDGVKVGVGPGCFAAGTRVLMADGTYRDIQDVRAGDRVITGGGHATTVVRAWCTGVRQVVAARHAATAGPTLATADHRYLTGDASVASSATAPGRGHVGVLARHPSTATVGWTQIGQATGQWLLFPRRVRFELPEHLRLDLCGVGTRGGSAAGPAPVVEESEDLGYLLGTFLGGGQSLPDTARGAQVCRVSWSVAAHEVQVTGRLCEAVERVTGIRPARGEVRLGVRRVHLDSPTWARLLSSCGDAELRHLPDGWLCSQPGYLRGLLHGLRDSAGGVDADGSPCLRTASRALAELFGVLCLLVHGSLPVVSHEGAAAGGLPAARGAGAAAPWWHSRLAVAAEPSALPDHTEVELLDVRATGLAVPVYDLEVEDDSHSFIADNAVVHNSICTTRVVAGVGVPQVTAIHEAAQACRPAGVPVVGDGGVQYSGDIAKALVAGADTVMLGSLLAGCDESPGELVFVNGKQFKTYRGMGSIGAMASRGKKSFSKDRYFQADVASDDKIVPEGVEGQVAYRGALAGVVHQLVGGLHQSMFYVGARTVAELQERGQFVQITAAGLKESHPHDVVMTVEAPNYSASR